MLLLVGCLCWKCDGLGASISWLCLGGSYMSIALSYCL